MWERESIFEFGFDFLTFFNYNFKKSQDKIKLFILLTRSKKKNLFFLTGLFSQVKLRKKQNKKKTK